jgi:DNA-binding phage protein
MRQNKKNGSNPRWRDGFEERLRDPEYAREYLLAAIEDGANLQQALADVVRAAGTTRYAGWAKKLERSNILRIVRKGSNPTMKTIERLLEPLGLRLAVVKA